MKKELWQQGAQSKHVLVNPSSLESKGHPADYSRELSREYFRVHLGEDLIEHLGGYLGEHYADAFWRIASPSDTGQLVA